MIKNKINISILIVITSIILFHFINFTKPISGNPIVYNLCAKELANNFELSLFYSGLSNPFYCNFHSMLSTFLLALPYKIFGSTVLVSKIFNFFLLLLFIFFIFSKEKSNQTRLLIISIWLSIPIVFQAFHNTDPDGNVGIFLIPIMFYALMKENTGKINFFYIFTLLSLIICNKELTGIVVSLALIFTSFFYDKKIVFKCVITVIFSWIFFISTYFFLINIFNLPNSMIIDLYFGLNETIVSNNPIYKKFILILPTFKGYLKWIGILNLFLFFILFYKILNRGFTGIKNLNFAYKFAIISFFGGAALTFLASSFLPRYILPFLLPIIIMFIKFCLNDENRELSKKSLILIIIYYLFAILVSKDFISTTSNLTTNDLKSLLKIFILLSPLGLYLVLKFFESGNIFVFNKTLIILLLLIPNCLIIFYQSISSSQFYTQQQGLKGFKETTNYIMENEMFYDQIFVDHVDLGFYLKNKVAHLEHPAKDIPSFTLMNKSSLVEYTSSEYYAYNFEDFFKKLKQDNSNFKFLLVFRNNISINSQNKILDKIHFLEKFYNKNKICKTIIEDFYLIQRCQK